MPPNPYDQAGRYLAKIDPLGFLLWLLADPTLALLFRGWLDTRSIPFPGEPDRICDTVADLVEISDPDPPWIVPVEFAVKPDGEMFGRLLEYPGRLWREIRSPGRGRRFRVGAAVVNLTGKRQTASRRMRLGRTRVLTELGVAEINLARESAPMTLAGIAAGRIAHCILPLIPLMRGGADPAIMEQWLQLARRERDRRRQDDYAGLALVFADLAGCQPLWERALEGWNVIQSQVVNEWMGMGEVRRQVAALLRVLELRFPPGAPRALARRIRSTTDLDLLSRWFDAAVTAPSLADVQRLVQS